MEVPEFPGEFVSEDEYKRKLRWAFVVWCLHLWVFLPFELTCMLTSRSFLSVTGFVLLSPVPSSFPELARRQFSQACNSGSLLGFCHWFQPRKIPGNLNHIGWLEGREFYDVILEAHWLHKILNHSTSVLWGALYPRMTSKEGVKALNLVLPPCSAVLLSGDTFMSA